MSDDTDHRKGRRRVVAVIAYAFDHYQRQIVETIAARLALAGYGTLCLAGHDHDAVESDTRDIRHPLAGRVDVRGSIVLSGVIGRAHPVSALARFARRLGDGPVISLGIAVPGVPSVALDAEDALARLMAHMTRDPRHRRFAFVRGYADGPESNVRERAFRAGLLARGLEIDESLFFEGRFVTADAYAAIDAALARGLRFDGLVAANDAMAASAVVALEHHGLSVPRDVIVAGFDDLPIAIELQPSLTTVRQRVHDQAFAAAERLLDALENADGLDPHVPFVIDAELVLRDSSRPEPRKIGEDPLLNEAYRAADATTAIRHLLEQRLRAAPCLDERHVRRATIVFVAALTGSRDGASARWERLGSRPVSTPGLHWWRHARRQLEHFAARLPEPPSRARAEVIAGLLARLDEALAAARTRAHLEQYGRRQLHERLLLELAACSTLESIWSLLRRGLGTLDVRRAWVLMHDPAGDDAVRDRRLASVRFALDGSASSPDEAPYPFARVLPDRLDAELERGTLVLVPLHDGRHELGHLLLDPLEGSLLELDAIAAGLAHALRQVRQVTDLEHQAAELRRTNEALTTLARHDSLTGLPNRAAFREHLDAALRSARDAARDTASDGDDEVALLFFDLDGFKLINDTLGHGAGDELLRIVAERARRVLRAGDVLARLGGDEFTIIAPQRAGEGGERRIAADVLATVARPCRLGERVVDVSASIGIAVFPVDGDDAGTLLRNADTAMYHAKACGKNRHARYAPVLNTDAVARLELHDAIRRALDAGDFRMHYQPRVELASGRLTAFEALMRWPCATGEPIGPDRFIPVAEETGLIAALDAFALDESCRQGRAWLDAGLPVSIAVNLSVRRLHEIDIVEQVLGALSRHDLPASLLELEITESAAMTDVEGNIVKLGALREAGVHIAIDDFGTGYSSLNYLKRLPVTSLKIDRSFLGDVGEESADAAIVRAVIALGRSMKFRLVAEGIENEAQLDFLLGLGCDEGQGYLFDRALDGTEATTRLRARAGHDGGSTGQDLAASG